jgi:hypothetical protein
VSTYRQLFILLVIAAGLIALLQITAQSQK